MAAARNSWSPSIWGLSIKAFLLLLIAFTAILLFLPAKSMKKVYWADRKLVEERLGADTLQNVEKKSSAWFKSAIIDTGILEESYGFWGKHSGVTSLEKGIGESAASRLDVFWMCIRHMFFRFGLLHLWLPCALALLPTLLIDAWLKRKVRQNQFSSANTLQHHLTGTVITLVALFMVVTPLLPLPIEPFYVPVGLAVCGFVVWLWLAMYQKRS